MRAAPIPALLLAVLSAPAASADSPGVPVPAVDAASDSAPDVDVLLEDMSGEDPEDAPGIQEDLSRERKELEELLDAESRAIDHAAALPLHRSLLGPANPLRARAFDAQQRGALLAGEPHAEGDAGGLLAELGGLDLAALKAEYDIPIEINDMVLQYVRFFKGDGRKWFTRWLARSHVWIPMARPILAEEGVPLDLVYLAMIESGFSPYAWSRARASGMWQFISGTGRRYGLRDDFWVDERRDPVKSTRAAARYLKALHDEFGDWYLAWAGYNAGEGRIRKAIAKYGTRDFWEIADESRALRQETRHYVPKLIAAALVARHPQRFGFEDAETDGAFDFEEVEVPDATDLDVLAKAAGSDVEKMRLLNPSLRRWCSPPQRDGRGYVVRVPRGTREAFVAAYAKIRPSDRLTFRHHRVVKGDTPGAIAAKFGVPVEPILKFNQLKSARALRIGMDLVIPLPALVASRYPDKDSGWRDEGRARRGRAQGKAVAVRERRAQAAPTAPGGRGYVIRGGDTLWSISQKFGVDVDDLKRWYRIGRRGARELQVGRSLQVSPPGRRKAERTVAGRSG